MEVKDKDRSSRKASFKFGWREIEYYQHDVPGLFRPEYFMLSDIEIIERYMNLKFGDVFLDIGSTFGSWTLPALCQGADVIAVEPHPILAMCLLENALLNSWDTRLKVVNMAAWGEGDQLIPYNILSQSSFKEFPEVQPIYVNSVTIDSMELERIKMIKIDVEGAEKEVLKGTQESIKRCHPIIILENHIDLCGEVDIDGYNKTELEDGKILFH